MGHADAAASPVVLYIAVADDAAPQEAYAAQALANVTAQAMGARGSASVVSVAAAVSSGLPHVAVGVGAARAANVTIAELAAMEEEEAGFYHAPLRSA